MEEGPFRPPERFIKASKARQMKIQQMQERRESPEPPDSSLMDNKKRQLELPVIEQDPNISTQKSTPKSNKKTTGRDSPSSLRKSSITNSIEDIRIAREQRRAQQAEVKKVKMELSNDERKFMGYKFLIDQFRMNLKEQIKEVPINENKNVHVYIRKRPMNAKELDPTSPQFDVLTPVNNVIYIHETKTKLDLSQSIDTHEFKFDGVFDETSCNENVYEGCIKPKLFNTVLSEKFVGRNINSGVGRFTVFVYGQTGSGKSYTIFGNDQHVVDENLRTGGVFDLACADVLKTVSKVNEESAKNPIQGNERFYYYYNVEVSFYEIYGGKLYDLLNGRNRLTLLESQTTRSKSSRKVEIPDLSAIQVNSFEELFAAKQTGERARSMGETEVNQTSSRSHAIFKLYIRRHTKVFKNGRWQINGSELLGNLAGELSFAGSERATDLSHTNAQSRLEAAEINKSLLALKECIRAIQRSHMDAETKHVPFRGSKLTLVLRDALDVSLKRKTNNDEIGVLMIATVSPNSNSVEHTLNTIRYADRVMDFGGSVVSKKMDKMEIDSSKLIRSDEFNQMDLVQSDDNAKSDSPRNQSSSSLTVKSKTQKPVKSLTKKLREASISTESISKNNNSKSNSNEFLPNIFDGPKGSDSVSTLESSTDDVTEELSKSNENLSKQLFELEDKLIHAHIITMQKNLGISAKEEELLTRISRSESNFTFEDYTFELENIIQDKALLLQQLREQIIEFKNNKIPFIK